MRLNSTMCLLLVVAQSTIGQVLTFEGNSFPEENDDWFRYETLYLADRWTNDGWLVQNPEIADLGPPVVGEQDHYVHPLAFLTGVNIFIEWKMVTDGPEAFGAIAPAVLSAYNESGILYHFVIGDDRLSFTRDAFIPILYPEFLPGPHVYRLELRGTDSFTFWIDDNEVVTAVPEGPYPTLDSAIVFGVRAAIQASTTMWSYIRVGKIQHTHGDFDSDDDFDAEDWYFFQECLDAAHHGPGSPAWPGCVWADMDDDNDVDFHDFRLFQFAFTGAAP